MDKTEYYNQHQACPECGSNNIESTTLGYVVMNNDYTKFKDCNKARCGCGCGCRWKGIVHKLVPYTPPTIVRGEE